MLTSFDKLKPGNLKISLRLFVAMILFKCPFQICHDITLISSLVNDRNQIYDMCLFSICWIYDIISLKIILSYTIIILYIIPILLEFLEICDIYVIVQRILLELLARFRFWASFLRSLGFPSSRCYIFSVHLILW